MPFWEFQCPSCHHIEAKMFPTFEDIRLFACSFCEFHHGASVLMTRMPCAGTFILKGPGFHKNDYPNEP